jgi:hypothetical protein
MERRGNIFNEMCLVPLLEEEEGDMRGGKSLLYSIFAFPEFGDFEGRGNKLSYYNFNYINVFILIFILK